MPELAILTLNVCSPSRARAERQLEWLSGRPEHVLVLTEISEGGGSSLLAQHLRTAGWEVRHPAVEGSERGVLIASRVQLERTPTTYPVEYLPARAQAISIGGLEIVGVYAPSRDESAEKVARKRRFLSELWTILVETERPEAVLIGDLNIVEPGIGSPVRLFQNWEIELYEELLGRGWVDAYRALHPDRVEYSWIDIEGQGFRFDHVFVSSGLTHRLQSCNYLHEPRERELSDHSAMLLNLADVAYEPLAVDSSLSGDPPSLF